MVLMTVGSPKACSNGRWCWVVRFSGASAWNGRVAKAVLTESKRQSKGKAAIVADLKLFSQTAA